MLIEFFCIATSASVQWSFLCIHVFWTYAKTTHRLIMYYFTFSYFSSSINKKNMFALPHKKYARTGVCRFSFLSFFSVFVMNYPTAPERINLISRLWKNTNWHQFQKSNFFLSQNDMIFFSCMLFPICKQSVRLLSFYFIYWSNVMERHTSIDWNLFFSLGFGHHIYFELVYVIRFVFDWFNSISFVFFSSKKSEKKPIWVTKKIYAQNWFCEWINWK